ncbi:DUF1697 domain-containing protein [Zunongwangia sp.]|uniref:DUF1697 domain-containing protein n=1 Tax=Zunongwangia sp. TaxID=1965325 RepID=UPI003AA9A20B
MTKIAILRGINVGGKRKILMKDLKTLCERLDLEKVSTYIQSGNIIFQSSQDNSALENKLEKAIFEQFGFEVPVIIRTAEEIQFLLTNNPFYTTETENTHLHLTFLKHIPTTENQQKTEALQYNPDRFLIHGKNVFLYCEGKYHKTKLSNTFFEKKLKVGATTRNWKTVIKLSELSSAQN